MKTVTLTTEQWAMVVAGLSAVAAQAETVANSPIIPPPTGSLTPGLFNDLRKLANEYRALAAEVRIQTEPKTEYYCGECGKLTSEPTTFCHSGLHFRASDPAAAKRCESCGIVGGHTKSCSYWGRALRVAAPAHLSGRVGSGASRAAAPTPVQAYIR